MDALEVRVRLDAVFVRSFCMAWKAVKALCLSVLVFMYPFAHTCNSKLFFVDWSSTPVAVPTRRGGVGEPLFPLPLSLKIK